MWGSESDRSDPWKNDGPDVDKKQQQQARVHCPEVLRKNFFEAVSRNQNPSQVGIASIIANAKDEKKSSINEGRGLAGMPCQRIGDGGGAGLDQPMRWRTSAMNMTVAETQGGPEKTK